MTRQPRLYRCLCRVFLMVAAAVPLSGQSLEEQTVRNEYVVDWVARELVIRTTRPVETQGANAPVSVHLTQREADYSLPQLLNRAIRGVQRDTAETVGTATEDLPTVATKITRLIPSVQRTSLRRSSDLSELTVEYRLPLFPAATELFGLHEVASPLPQNLQRVPSRDFTGILVYVADPLPVHGTNRVEHLQGALFPRIYDTEMNLVLEPAMMNPEYLQRWGPVAYSTDPETTAYEERIGDAPLRILARGIFGTTPTDLLISTTDAARVLGREANLDLLRQGRIVVVIAPESARTEIEP